MKCSKFQKSSKKYPNRSGIINQPFGNNINPKNTIENLTNIKRKPNRLIVVCPIGALLEAYWSHGLSLPGGFLLSFWKSWGCVPPTHPPCPSLLILTPRPHTPTYPPTLPNPPLFAYTYPPPPPTPLGELKNTQISIHVLFFKITLIPYSGCSRFD